MENLYLFIERCLKDLNTPENEDKVVEILEGLSSDIIIDDVPPEFLAVSQLRDLGEDTIVENHIMPLIADLVDEVKKLEAEDIEV